MRRRRSLYQPPALIVEDEYQGQGGSYLLDPETGLRTLVFRTSPAEEVRPTPENPEVTTDAAPDTEASHPD